MGEGRVYDKDFSDIAAAMKQKILGPHRAMLNTRIKGLANKLSSLALEEGFILDA